MCQCFKLTVPSLHLNEYSAIESTKPHVKIVSSAHHLTQSSHGFLMKCFTTIVL